MRDYALQLHSPLHACWCFRIAEFGIPMEFRGPRETLSVVSQSKDSTPTTKKRGAEKILGNMGAGSVVSAPATSNETRRTTFGRPRPSLCVAALQQHPRVHPRLTRSIKRGASIRNSRRTPSHARRETEGIYKKPGGVDGPVRKPRLMRACAAPRWGAAMDGPLHHHAPCTLHRHRMPPSAGGPCRASSGCLGHPASFESLPIIIPCKASSAGAGLLHRPRGNGKEKPTPSPALHERSAVAHSLHLADTARSPHKGSPLTRPAPPLFPAPSSYRRPRGLPGRRRRPGHRSPQGRRSYDARARLPPPAVLVSAVRLKVSKPKRPSG